MYNMQQSINPLTCNNTTKNYLTSKTYYRNSSYTFHTFRHRLYIPIQTTTNTSICPILCGGVTLYKQEAHGP